MLTEADVSVIIVNYNGAHVLRAAIQSVLALLPAPGELIIVDNGSTDDSLAVIREFDYHALVRPIVAGQNLGVAGGRNLGVTYAFGKIYAFLDADGMAQQRWLSAAVALLNQRPEAGAIAPLVLLADGQTINGAGSFLDRSGHGRDRFWNEPLKKHQKEMIFLAASPVDYPMGCGMVLRKEGLERIWPLDEGSLKWHDDTEIGIRIRRLGYHVLFTPDSTVLHNLGHSDPTDNDVRHLMAEEARFRLLLKYYPFSVFLGALSSFVLHGIWGVRNRPDSLKDTVKLLRSILKSLREVLPIRKTWRVH